jgi:hypothetical protein
MSQKDPFLSVRLLPMRLVMSFDQTMNSGETECDLTNTNVSNQPSTVQFGPKAASGQMYTKIRLWGTLSKSSIMIPHTKTSVLLENVHLTVWARPFCVTNNKGTILLKGNSSINFTAWNPCGIQCAGRSSLTFQVFGGLATLKVTAGSVGIGALGVNPISDCYSLRFANGFYQVQGDSAIGADQARTLYKMTILGGSITPNGYRAAGIGSG